MDHTLEFTRDTVVDVATSPKQFLERLLMRKGARVRAEVRPRVLEAPGGPMEVADLFFADGTSARSVPFNAFSFLD